MKFSKNKATKREYRVNEEISYDNSKNVRLVGQDFESRVVSFDEANKIASQMGLDLIEINSSLDIPILRLANYEKFLYEQKKAEKKSKNSPKPLKEIDLSVNIASNDLKTKANKAREFIKDGSKVRVVLSFKGREMSRREANKKSFLEFIVMLEDVAVPESMPRDEGNKTSVILKKK